MFGANQMPCDECILRQAELAASVMIEMRYLAWGEQDERPRMQTAGLQPGLVKSSGCCAKVAKIDLQNAVVWTMHDLDRKVRWTYTVQVDWHCWASTASSGETWKRKQFQLWWYKILNCLMPRLLTSVESGMLPPKLWWLTSKTRMDVKCLIKGVKLASSGGKGQLNKAHSNAGRKMKAMRPQPAGTQLLGCIAVVPWTQLRWR